METVKKVAIKTFKREVAIALLIIMIGFFIAGYWWPYFQTIGETIKVETFLFAGGAFGLDAIKKQLGKGDAQ